ncbi:MAG: flippase-like domain-containing protein, partial [Aquificaceae bacterium]
MLRSLIYGIALTLFFVVASLIYILKKSVSKDILVVIFQIEKRYLFLSLFAIFLYHTFDNLRLFVLSRAMNLKYSFLYGYIISLINTFGATITPAHMGGEFMSLYTLSRKGGKLHKVMSIVTMKTLTGLAFFLLAFPYALFYLYKNPKTFLKILTIFILFFLAFFVIYLAFK